MVEFKSIDTLREALAPVEALRGEQSELEAWVRESFATLDSLHGELSDWQRDLIRQEALLDQRQAAIDDHSESFAAQAELERRLAAAEEENRQLLEENNDQLQSLEAFDRQLAIAKTELRLLQRSAEEHRQWHVELREMRLAMEIQAGLLRQLTLTNLPVDALAAVDLSAEGADLPESSEVAGASCSAADLRRRADLRRAASRRTT